MEFDWHKEVSDTIYHDQRVKDNLVKIYERKASSPEASFSASLGESLRKSSYRIFSNKGTDVQYGHNRQTASRCSSYDYVLVSEDTTDLNYHSHQSKKGIGNLGGHNDCRGVCLHSALALSPSGLPLGLLGQYLWAPDSSGKNRKKRSSIPIEQKESYKWLKTLHWCEDLLGDYDGRVIIVGDREADFYEHMKHSRSSHLELLIRARNLQRKVLYQGNLLELSELSPLLTEAFTYQITIPRQKKQKKRNANLGVKYTKITMPPAYGFPKNDPSIDLYLVVVEEENPPKGAEAVNWWLYTTLSPEVFELQNLDAFAQLMISFYKKRWLVERFHFVLKQGLKAEQIQYSNYIRLKNALKVCSVIAWYLLWCKLLIKSVPTEKAADYFTQEDCELLTCFAKKSITTIEEFILALAGLINFKPTRGQPLPGEKRLWQAIQKFTIMKEAIRLSK